MRLFFFNFVQSETEIAICGHVFLSYQDEMKNLCIGNHNHLDQYFHRRVFKAFANRKQELHMAAFRLSDQNETRNLCRGPYKYHCDYVTNNIGLV